MRFLTCILLASHTLLFATAQEAAAKRVAILVVPPAVRAVTAETVVLGKVESIEADPVEALPFPGAEEKIPYKVGVIKIQSALAGAKGLTHIKVGVPAGGNGGGGRGPRLGGAPVSLEAGQEGCFFLVKHPTASLWIIPMGANPILENDPEYKATLENVKKSLEIAADPAKALKAEKAADRFTAAAVLISKYRTMPEGVGEVENVKVPAAQSKAIVDALLATENWNAADPVTGKSAIGLAQILALGPNEGFQPAPFSGNNYATYFKGEFQKWAKTMPKDFSIRQMVRKEQK